MPLTEKGEEILREMEKQYGEEKGKQVFYASRNAGTISGVDHAVCTTYDPYIMPVLHSESD